MLLHGLEGGGLGILLFLEDVLPCISENSPIFPAEFDGGQHENPYENQKENPEEEVAQQRPSRILLHFKFLNVDFDWLVYVGEGDGLMIMLIGVGESNSNEERIYFLLEYFFHLLFLEED